MLSLNTATLCTKVMLPAFWGEQVHATGRNINNAPTDAMLLRRDVRFTPQQLLNI